MTKKFMVIALVMFLLTGCSNHRNSKTQKSSPILATESVDEKQQFKPTYENFNKILDYNKEDVLEYLGNNYQIVMAGAEGVAEGYYYEELDLTIFFEDKEPYKIAVIDCGDHVDIIWSR